MAETKKITSRVSLLSFLSGASLVLFGGGTLLLSAFGGGLDGALIGMALTGHGLYELWQRKELLARRTMSVARKLAWNQAALAGSVLLYLGWQVKSIDSDELAVMMASDPARSLLELFPPELSQMYRSELPRMLVSFYGLAGVVVLFGCLGMASLYVRSVKSAGQR